MPRSWDDSRFQAGYPGSHVPITRKTGTIQTLIAFDGTLRSWWTRIVFGALLFVFCVVQRVMGEGARQ